MKKPPSPSSTSSWVFSEGVSEIGRPVLSTSLHILENLELSMVDPVFSRRVAPTRGGGGGGFVCASTYYLATYLPKIACKWKKLDGGVRP